jgi:hypothetical protein
MSNLKNRVLKIEATQVKPPNYSHLTREQKIARIEELNAMSDRDTTLCPNCPDCSNRARCKRIHELENLF